MPPRKKKNVAVDVTPSRGRHGGNDVQSLAASSVVGESDETDWLYEHVLNEDASLEEAASSWLEKYESEPMNALLDLVNFLIHASGCTSSITEDALEQEAVEEAFEELQKEFKKEYASEYPLVSKSKEFKAFRQNALEFWARLFSQGKETILSDEKFLTTIKKWIVGMSTSHARPFRHTAVAISYHWMTCLCDLIQPLHQELANLMRQQQAKGSSSGRKKKAGTKNENKIEELNAHKKTLDTHLDDLSSDIFKQRYRDVEPIIRIESLKELVIWINKYEDFFLKDDYLRYFYHLINDQATAVRIEAIRGLAKLFTKERLIPKLRNVTLRIRDRLVEAAMMDTDLSVRISAIGVLTHAAKAGFLENAHRKQLCRLLFADHPRLRKSIAPLVCRTLAEDYVEPKLTALEDSEEGSETPTQESVEVGNDEVKKKKWVVYKCLAEFLVETSAKINEEAKSSVLTDHHVDTNEEVTEVRSEIFESNLNIPNEDDAWIDGFEQTTRSPISEILEALWHEVDELKDWGTIEQFLCYDHTITQADIAWPRGRLKEMNESYRLTETEETVLVEVFVGCLRLTITPPDTSTAIAKKKKVQLQNEEEKTNISRHMIDTLPQLLTKYAPEPSRLYHILTIPSLMNLDIYLDMRKILAFEELVDQIGDLFLKHTCLDLIANAATTIAHIGRHESLAMSYRERLESLRQEVVKSFVQECKGLDIPTAYLSVDKLRTLAAAITRIQRLGEYMNLNEELDKKIKKKSESDLEEGFEFMEISAFQLVSQLVDRGGLGYQEEEKMIIAGISTLFQHLSWNLKTTHSSNIEEDLSTEAYELLRTERSNLLEMFDEYAFQSENRNDRPTTEGVRRTAFTMLGDLYWLFTSDLFYNARGRNMRRLYLRCPLTTQKKIEEAITKEIEDWREILSAVNQANQEANSQGDNLEDERDEYEMENEDRIELQTPRKSGKRKGTNKYMDIVGETKPIFTRKGQQPVAKYSFVSINPIKRYNFCKMMAAFARLAIMGVINVRHAKTLLSYYGRLDDAFDEIVRGTVDVLRGQMMQVEEDSRLQPFMQTWSAAMSSSLMLYINDSGENDSISPVQSLAKTLWHAFKAREGDPRPRAIMTGLRALLRLHQDGIRHVTNFISEENISEKEKRRALKYFIILTYLLNGISGRDASNISEYMEKTFGDHSIVPDEDTSEWSPYYTYVRRLMKIAASKGLQLSVGRTPRSVGRKRSLATVGGGDEYEGDPIMDDEDFATSTPSRNRRSLGKKKSTPRRKQLELKVTSEIESEGEGEISKRKRGRLASVGEEDEDQEAEDEGQLQDRRKQRKTEIGVEEAEIMTPKRGISHLNKEHEEDIDGEKSFKKRKRPTPTPTRRSQRVRSSQVSYVERSEDEEEEGEQEEEVESKLVKRRKSGLEVKATGKGNESQNEVTGEESEEAENYNQLEKEQEKLGEEDEGGKVQEKEERRPQRRTRRRGAI
ncbi:uncharacterized protein VTP21DRAFT_8054 [Calcarisporiella thermophila]|uniref:uncharacterized protein n=1 Tax=Calcarisporiella thermophila TaxID=911321 RepID=UPI003744A275